MHTHKANQGTTFHYNSDFSGEVIITNTGNAVPLDPGQEIRIPAEDLLEFTALCYVAPQSISKIEEAEWKTLLGGE